MSQKRKKPFLNRKETKSLLTTLKLATTAGALSLTIAGWGLLAQLDSAQAATNQPVAVVASVGTNNNTGTSSSISTGGPNPPIPTSLPSTTQSATTQRVRHLDIVQWVQDVRGNKVAVVRDKRGALWYVMGSDVPRLEQGQAPLVQPQLVRVTTRTRAS
jgi:hypothetical protein